MRPKDLAGATLGMRAMYCQGMLVYQGTIGFEMWTGEGAPVAVMRKALSMAFAWEVGSQNRLYNVDTLAALDVHGTYPALGNRLPNGHTCRQRNNRTIGVTS